MNEVVEVLPDVSGIDRAFSYEIPESLQARLKVGSIVRVVLNGRRVRGWVVKTAGARPPAVELRPVEELVSLGPPECVVDLARWAAWRYAGRLRPVLVAASPQRIVRELPPPLARELAMTEQAPDEARQGSQELESEIAAVTRAALSSASAVLRLPPSAPRLAVVRAVIEATRSRRGDLLVLASSRNDAATLAGRLGRFGHLVALYPDGWAEAASGGRIVVGTRSGVLAPCADLRAVVVLDAQADVYQEERAPTWEATVLALERARRADAPCLLVSPCPTLDLLAGRPLFTLARATERAGWALVEVLDQKQEDPRSRGYSTRLAQLIRDAASREPTRPVVAVLNRKGRARLLACERCRSLLRCEQCGAALIQLERPALGEVAVLSCPSCHWQADASCRACGPTRPRIVRPGVARAREDLAALTGLEVAELTAGSVGNELPDAQVLIGTEAVLHRAGSASVVVFLDFDQELLAPRYRAGEQALALLALASRLVGGRRRDGRVVIRTRLSDHEVIASALHADPSRLTTLEEGRRALLHLPPTTELAVLSGEGAPEYVARLKAEESSLEVGGLANGRFLLRAAGAAELANGLADLGPPPSGTRIEVAPRHV